MENKRTGFEVDELLEMNRELNERLGGTQVDESIFAERREKRLNGFGKKKQKGHKRSAARGRRRRSARREEQRRKLIVILIILALIIAAAVGFFWFMDWMGYEFYLPIQIPGLF